MFKFMIPQNNFLKRVNYTLKHQELSKLNGFLKQIIWQLFVLVKMSKPKSSYMITREILMLNGEILHLT